mgnify:CR=1 FL=1
MTHQHDSGPRKDGKLDLARRSPHFHTSRPAVRSPSTIKPPIASAFPLKLRLTVEPLAILRVTVSAIWSLLAPPSKVRIPAPIFVKLPFDSSYPESLQKSVVFRLLLPAVRLLAPEEDGAASFRSSRSSHPECYEPLMSR